MTVQRNFGTYGVPGTKFLCSIFVCHVLYVSHSCHVVRLWQPHWKWLAASSWNQKHGLHPWVDRAAVWNPDSIVQLKRPTCNAMTMKRAYRARCLTWFKVPEIEKWCVTKNTLDLNQVEINECMKCLPPVGSIAGELVRFHLTDSTQKCNLAVWGDRMKQKGKQCWEVSQRLPSFDQQRATSSAPWRSTRYYSKCPENRWQTQRLQPPRLFFQQHRRRRSWDDATTLLSYHICSTFLAQKHEMFPTL